MSQITISINKQVTKRIKLARPVYTIGRDRKCDIVLPERTVSSYHAKLINSGEDCFLEDTDSTNGVYVNNRSVRQYLLMDHDVIRIGKYHLIFRATISLATQLRQLSVHPRLIDKPTSSSWLEINSGSKQGNVIPLERDKITLGEQGIGTITIERHPRNGYLLHDPGSYGELTEAVKLKDNDSFSIGDIELVFHGGQ